MTKMSDIVNEKFFNEFENKKVKFFFQLSLNLNN